MKQIIHANNYQYLKTLTDETVGLIYIDPPFNTGKVQQRTRTTIPDHANYNDTFNDYLAFMVPRLEEAYRLLTPSGSLFVHLDYHEVHRIRMALDKLFGEQSFMNEIIWAYDFGGRSKKKWPAKHDNILWYAKDPKNYTFNYDDIDRVPYLAPGLAGPKKTAKGKVPTDVWWHTIVTGKEKTGYPTQKPLDLLERIVRVHSTKNDVVLDFFAGSGTTGEAAEKLGRQYIMIDDNIDAITIMINRLPKATVKTKEITDQEHAEYMGREIMKMLQNPPREVIEQMQRVLDTRKQSTHNLYNRLPELYKEGIITIHDFSK